MNDVLVPLAEVTDAWLRNNGIPTDRDTVVDLLSQGFIGGSVGAATFRADDLADQIMMCSPSDIATARAEAEEERCDGGHHSW